MRLLLDTNALLWAISDPGKLRRESIEAIEDPANIVAVSPAASWEIEIKRATGKLRTPDDLAEELERAGFATLPITIEHGIAAGRLPLHHRDPFDRLMIAQAQLEGLTIVTNDEKIARYQVAVLPA